jgi:hypothetical protein
MRSAGNVRWNGAAGKEWVVDDGVQRGDLSKRGDDALCREFTLVVVDTPGHQLVKENKEKELRLLVDCFDTLVPEGRATHY